MTGRNNHLKKMVRLRVAEALSLLDKAHKILTNALQDEKAGCLVSSTSFYDYGMTDINLHKMRIGNASKGLRAILAKRPKKVD
jgi:hypothetical protein